MSDAPTVNNAHPLHKFLRTYCILATSQAHIIKKMELNGSETNLDTFNKYDVPKKKFLIVLFIC